MKRLSMLTVLLFVTIGHSSAETLEITAAIDKKSLTTGDFLIYQIEVTHPPHLQLQPLMLEDYMPEGIDVELVEFAPHIQGQAEESSLFADLWLFYEEKIPTTRWSWRLWPAQEGTWAIPEIEIESLPTEGTQHPVRYQGKTEMQTFTVRSFFQSDPQNPQPPVLKVNQELPPSPFTKTWIWLLLGGVAVILGVLGYLFYKRSKPPVLVEEEEAPNQRALRRLQELKHFILTNPRQVQHYYLALSEIFREYLENQFDFPASSMTTQEILPLLQSETPYTSEEHEQIVFLTNKSDLVKYAKGLSNRAEMEVAYNQVVTWIERIACHPVQESEVQLRAQEVQEVA